MKRTFLKTILCCAMLLIAGSTLQAQKIITAYGKVLYQAEGVRITRPYPKQDVHILAFNTVEAAKEAKKLFDSGSKVIIPDAIIETPCTDGYYEIRVAENGALLIWINKQTVLVEVNDKEEHNVIIKEESVILEEVTVIAKRRSPDTTPLPSKIRGTQLCFRNEINIPEELTGKRQRVVLMPYVVDCTTKDTIARLDTMVIDGTKYIPPKKKLSDKKKGDPLAKYVNLKHKMDDGDFSVILKDTLNLVEPNKNYTVCARVKIEDHTHIIYENDLKLTNGKAKRPLLFLEPTDTTDRSLKEAYHQCLNHGYDYRNASDMQEWEERKKIFEKVKNSSPMNHVVMCMAMETDYYNEEALGILETIPPTAQAKYLKLQLYYRMNDIKNFEKHYTMIYYMGDPELDILMNAYRMLDEIIKEDAKFRNIAINDGEFSEEFIDHYIDADKRKELQELWMPY